MSSRNGRSEPSRDQIGRLVEVDRPARPARRGEIPAKGPLPHHAPGVVTGLDDVRAPLADPPKGIPRLRRRGFAPCPPGASGEVPAAAEIAPDAALPIAGRA